MNKEEFENFKNEWYEENCGLNLIHYRNVNKDVVNDIIDTLQEDFFSILEKYNEKINQKKD